MEKNKNAEPNISAIPTKYKGIQMRSILEARWAAFFDLMGWSWSYEPVNFEGWIPDFVLYGHERKVFVEIKPLFRFEELKNVFLKIQNSKCDENVLVFGPEIVLETSSPLNNTEVCWPYFGWLFDKRMHHGYKEDGVSDGWAAALMVKGDEIRPIGFGHEIGSWQDQLGIDIDNGDDQLHIEEHIQYVKNSWIEAQNFFQYKSPVY